jgi:hypothetical protein
MKEFVTIGYSYNELNDEAKEKVKQWYLNHDWRNEAFQENTEAYLLEQFPNSKLKVNYSLGYCQGDGLNIHGELHLIDFLRIWDAEDLKKSVMGKVLPNINPWYNFAENNHYSYSCKFIDRKNIAEDVQITMDELKEINFKLDDDACRNLLKKFYTALVNYFEKLDKKLEKDGYEYLYKCEDWEVEDFCEANDYYFNKNGELIG